MNLSDSNTFITLTGLIHCVAKPGYVLINPYGLYLSLKTFIVTTTKIIQLALSQFPLGD